MDLIFTNAERVDQGVLLDYELDMAFGSDENNFECNISSNMHCCDAGWMLYMDGTEYGGIIDAIQSKSDTKEVIYSGRTWQGVLNAKVLEPDSGADYLVCSGEANAVLGTLIARMGLSDLFVASSEDSGLTISNYKMDRYISGYNGIKKMLASVGGKLLFTFLDGKVNLSAAAIRDYTKDEEFDSDLVDFDIKKSYKTVNHLICLGKGELAERTVLHLYADADGNISKEQTFTGLDEVADIYDYSSVESEEELEAGGVERLQELWATDALNIDFDASDDSFDIGDIVGAFDNITKTSVAAKITKKIITVKNGKTTISYKVGE